MPSGVPAPARCTLVRTTPRAPSTRPHACLPGRPVAWSPVCSLARLPARPLACHHTHRKRHQEQTAVLARADTRAPHTTCPRRGPTLCVPTRIYLCKCHDDSQSAVDLSFLGSVPALAKRKLVTSQCTTPQMSAHQCIGPPQAAVYICLLLLRADVPPARLSWQSVNGHQPRPPLLFLHTM